MITKPPMRIFLLLLFVNQLPAQTTQIAGVINHYAVVTAFDTCTGAVSISDTTGFRAGGAVLIIQAQGAQIAAGNNGSYGQVQNMYAAGRYERASVDSVSATAIFLPARLLHDYNPAGQVQVVTIPRYASAIVTDTVRAQPWNGMTGGVLTLEVAGTLTLNAPLYANGTGFRGGLPYFLGNNNCNFAFSQSFYYYPLGNWRGGYKGQGTSLPISGKELGRGPQSNGGGGGNDHNSGGGGGGNSADGGRGGENNEPNTFGCSGHFPGIGGYGVLDNVDRLFFGGGGGAGHANNGLTSAGANGGGIILVQADSITGSHPEISASGLAAPTADGDGGGGGGAGGTIRLQVTTASNSLVVRADGGNGANTTNINANRCAGPGGGGSGGRIMTNLLNIAPPNGGQPGMITNSTNGCNGSNAGAEPGEPGFVQPLSILPQGTVAVGLPVIIANPQPAAVCFGENALFTVDANPGTWTYQWQSWSGGSWQDLTAGSIYSGVQSDSLHILGVMAGLDSLLYRAVAMVTNCGQTASLPALLTVRAAPTAGFTATINGNTVDFTNQSFQATGYFWDFGDGSPIVTSQDATHQYSQSGTYVVTLAVSSPCGAAILQQNVEVMVEGVGTLTALHLGRVRIFPNPAGEHLTVDCSAANVLPVSIQVFDTKGRLILTQHANILPVTELSLTGWPSGAYTVVVDFSQGKIVRTVVKE